MKYARHTERGSRADPMYERDANGDSLRKCTIHWFGLRSNNY